MHSFDENGPQHALSQHINLVDMYHKVIIQLAYMQLQRITTGIACIYAPAHQWRWLYNSWSCDCSAELIVHRLRDDELLASCIHAIYNINIQWQYVHVTEHSIVFVMSYLWGSRARTQFWIPCISVKTLRSISLCPTSYKVVIKEHPLITLSSWHNESQSLLLHLCCLPCTLWARGNTLNAVNVQVQYYYLSTHNHYLFRTHEKTA